MKMQRILGVILLGSIISSGCAQSVSSNKATVQSSNESEWVFADANGKLQYKTTPKGDKIIDFSHAGYMGGGVALPVVPVKRVVKSTNRDDDTKLIQDAIDEVAKMPLENGFRGAVLLDGSDFVCAKSIVISTSGIVLRGRGSGKNGTTIHMTGSKHTAIEIITPKSGPNWGDPVSKGSMVIDTYVPAGTISFTVVDASAFTIGDTIVIDRPVTTSWIAFMEMHTLKRDGRQQTWIGNNSRSFTTRKIIAINGNTITIDIPLADSYDAKYLNPPGTKVVKAGTYHRVTQVGIEQLHIQCDPLEIAYGNAPYSGIEINADDCWVKDVYFEETMNTTTLRGDRITMQRVVVKHTYTNLGASKPTDFSIEGSQNLLDRCEITGGNTYFVWTTSLDPGPNVILNCTFKGHGSRIQPHQRWSTGLLVDNCTVIDGGIDFLNRGVAGSGHGWTMGWAVAWNCIAKTYIIQNPPGAYNWAIGCIGKREQTARLFDTSPILPEGVFDQHGTPVAPQSLYLAQLLERKGWQALKNIGYDSNTAIMFANKHVQPTPPQKIVVDKIFGPDLAMHRPVNTNNVRGTTREFGGEKALDGIENTYWAVNDNITQATIEIDMEGPVVINTVEINEAKGWEGRVQEYQVEGQVDSDWKLLSQGTAIGARKVDTFPEATVWKVRVTNSKAQSYPAISKIGLYLKK